MRRAAVWVGVLLGCLACQRPAPQPPVVAPVVDAPAPLDPSTTSGGIAQSNLDSQIEALQQDVARRPACFACLSALAGRLLSRAQFFGRLSDLDRAEDLANRAAKLDKSGATLLARAHVLAALHRFTEARAATDAALAAHGNTFDGAMLQVTIGDALGEASQALAALKPLTTFRRETSTLGEEAILRGEAGETDAAAALWDEARRVYRDVSPFSVAFMEFQQGLMWERQGDTTRARTWFETAHRRLPGYVAAASHLAAVVPSMDEAISLLEPFADSEDPEPAAQLAQLLRLKRDGVRAEALVSRVRTAYEALTARHPEAFADHAARFWLGAGNDPARALVWATRNAGWRTTPASYQLLMEAALAANDTPIACRAATEAQRRAWKNPGVVRVIGKILPRCQTSAVGVP